MNKIVKSWKYPSILLVGIGISNVGAWIYLLALNLVVFDLTGSPLAVAGLYILIPLATIVTNIWSGSLIDRLNKRTLMIVLDLFRAVCIFALPWLLDASIWLLYIMVFLINMATAMFSPTSMSYITKLIPLEQRKRFNSLRSLIDSGAFLIGPAIAGILFIIGTPFFSIFINAVALFLSGIITLLIPNLEKSSAIRTEEKWSWQLVIRDFHTVMTFSRNNVYIMLIYFLFSSVIVMTAAVDSLEAAFAKEVLNLSDSDYGFLVSIAGAGIIIGAILNTLVVKKIATSTLMGVGCVFVSIGYIIYAYSGAFPMAALGFFILAFFLAFANTGFHTFYQNTIPIKTMGRIISLYGLVQSILVLLTTVIMGIVAQLISIQAVVIAGAFLMLLIAVILCCFTFQPSKRQYEQSAEFDRMNV
ncbi:MFS transporter [Alkalihalobacillus sp. MEB130]|uniref:MFS transporter n=1 Tax=Alkalihalobacillus sp. MEB130 TaxID=2976704 RepID=UPI0028E04CFE|nr:MFS transporter [Alkalihalobacillus sp. MEB130]MDT8860828.1 MFS transporter [Alkalihalobacillus sp. MEB130]